MGILVAIAFATVASAGAAQAQIGSDRYASLVVDAQSGRILSSANPDEYRFPASLTKMMTIFMVFEAVRDGRMSFSDPVRVSAWAASMPPTKLGLVPGSTLTVEQAVLGLVTKSANDAAAALGEMIGGDEDRFAQLMTVRAHALGMSRTTFRNASGLPDWGQVTTARDLVVLARHLIQEFPQYYHYFSTPQFVFRGRVVPNHQALLRTYAGADGLKTGYTEASGYNVVTSAVRADVRLIGVVLGASNGWERDQHMAALLDQGFMRMGVSSVEMARREPNYRVPSLIGAARAAPVILRTPSQPMETWPPRRAERREPRVHRAPARAQAKTGPAPARAVGKPAARGQQREAGRAPAKPGRQSANGRSPG